MELTPYTSIHASLNDSILTAVVKKNSAISTNIYPKGTLDHQFFIDAAVPTQNTVAAIYREFMPLVQPHSRGEDMPADSRIYAILSGIMSLRLARRKVR